MSEATPDQSSFRSSGLHLAGSALLVSVAIQRLFAVIELAGITGEIGAIDRVGLTIFQVQPLEPLMVLTGVALVLASNRYRSWALWLGVFLGAWGVLAGFVGLFQGMRLGLVQAQLQGRSTELASFAFTMRIATQTTVPAAAAMVVAVLSIRRGRSGTRTR